MFSLGDLPVENISLTEAQINYNLENCDDNEGYYKIRIGEILNNNYKITSKLGKGVYANVCKAICLSDNQEVAIKILRSYEQMLYSGQQEKALLENLNNSDANDKRHVVRLKGSFEFRRHICLIFELFDMNMRDALKFYTKGKGLTLDAIRSYGM